MDKITFKLFKNINEEILLMRYKCFNEELSYYESYESSKEKYDDDSLHLVFFVNNNIAGYTRLTPCPNNYMEIEKVEPNSLPNDLVSLEMGRTFVIKEYRQVKLLNLILAIGLNICGTIGYKKVIGNVSYEKHLKMPNILGFEFINEIHEFKMPFSSKGSHKFYLLECDLESSHSKRNIELQKIIEHLNVNNFIVENAWNFTV